MKMGSPATPSPQIGDSRFPCQAKPVSSPHHGKVDQTCRDLRPEQVGHAEVKHGVHSHGALSFERCKLIKFGRHELSKNFDLPKEFGAAKSESHPCFL